MNKENEKKNNGVAVKTEGQQTEWVFIPLVKKHIFRRTDKYVLFSVDGQASGIINAKFLRKKESEDMVYFSLPANYEVNCNVREMVDGHWTTTKKYVITAKDLRPIVLKYNKPSVPDDDLPF